MTEEGAGRFRDLGVKLQAMQDRFLAPLSLAERDTLLDLLIRLSGGEGR
jgi:hypothetical protein